MGDIFGYPKEYYRQYRVKDPVTVYLDSMSIYISKMKDIPIDEAKKEVEHIISSRMRNPEVTYYERDMDTGDKHIEKIGLRQYITSIAKQHLLSAPSLTCYVSHRQKPSKLVQFIVDRMKMRAKHKKLAIPAKAKGDMATFMYHNQLQQTMKRDSNSVSGLLTVRGSELYDYSAHYTLTSTTRCISAIGNVITEKMVAGNRYYMDPDSVINDIAMSMSYKEHDEIKRVVNNYRLHLPTAEEAMDVVLYSSRLYWINEEHEERIYKFLSKLDGMERAVFVYAGDLYHVKKFNKEFIYDILMDICRKSTKSISNPLEVISNTNPAVVNLVSHIFLKEIAGLGSNPADYPEDIRNSFAATCKSVSEKFDKYMDFLRPICTTPVLPINSAYIPNMIRRAILLSDTDSTCGTYQEWIMDYNNGNMYFSEETMGLAATVMTITTQTMAHAHKVFSARLGIGDEFLEILAMKNEFTWFLQGNNSATKHYMASIAVQEGNVYKEPELDIKGVHLIASKIPKKISTKAHDLMRFINREIAANRKLNLGHILKEVASIETTVIRELKNGNPDYLNYSKIKPEEEYLSNPMATPYFSHAMWMEVFADKYGVVDIPPYVAVKYNLTISTRTDMVNWIESIQDRELASRLQEFLQKHRKSVLKTIYLDMGYVTNNGVPDEIFMVVDYHKVALDMCHVFYLILEILGFYKPEKKLVGEIIQHGK